MPVTIGTDIGWWCVARRTTSQGHIVLGVEDVQFHDANLAKSARMTIGNTIVDSENEYFASHLHIFLVYLHKTIPK
jgi:hypothetical protein